LEILLPLREVEHRLGLSRWTLYELIHNGKLRALKLQSGHFRVPQEAVEKFAQRQRRNE
jgi:excisionase family DNA binding protein